MTASARNSSARVDRERVADGEATGVAAQPQRGCGDLVGRTHATDHRLRQFAVEQLRERLHRRGHGGVDEAGRDQLALRGHDLVAVLRRDVAKRDDAPVLADHVVVVGRADLLAFLPGTPEIRRTRALLEEGPREPGLVIHELYGELALDAQEAAIAPARPGERKLVLSTNVAETSLTIEGVRVVFDAEGRRYLDMFGGIATCALGHCHPALVSALQAQSQKLWHVTNGYFIEPQIELAERLTRASGLDRAFFCNSGGEANEAALKTARKYFHDKGEGRFEYVSAHNSFHGRTMGAVTATGQEKYRAGFEPLIPGFRYVPFGDIDALARSGGSLGERSVAEIMVRDPVTGAPDDTIDEMRGVMTDRHIRYLPIKQDGALLGVISFHDVAKAALKAASFENRLLKQYIKNWPDAE